MTATLESLDQKLDDLKDSVADMRTDLAAQRTENQTTVTNAFNQHALLHQAHELQHQSADTRFWAAVGILATGIIAIGGYVVLYGGPSPMIGFVGGGAVVIGSIILLQQKIGIVLGVAAARAYQTKPGARVMNWLMRLRWRFK